MLSETLADAVRNEFFSLMNSFDPNATIQDILRQEVAEVCGLMQKPRGSPKLRDEIVSFVNLDTPMAANDYECTDDDGNVYRDEVARHHAEMEKEKRKQANEQLLEQNEAVLGEKTGTIAILLLSAREDWMELVDDSS